MDAAQKRLAVIGALILIAFVALAPTFLKDSLPEWWPARPMRLGLDLKGGTYLVLEVKTKEAVRSHLDSVASTIRAELKKENAGLVKAKTVAQDTVEFTLLSERGVEKLDTYINENFPELKKDASQPQGARVNVTYKIGMKESNQIERDAVLQAVETIRNRVDQYGVSEPVIQRVGEKRIMVQLPDITNAETVKKTIGSVAKLEFRLIASPDTPEDETQSFKTREGARMRVGDQVLMSGDAIEKAMVEVSPRDNQIEVALKFNSLGKRTFGLITTENVSRQLAIVLDGVIQSYPVIREPITGGTAQISGGFTRDEALRLAVVLRSGALPAPLSFEEERTVGASLGSDSIRKGVEAMLFGSLAVFAFTIFYYKRAGMLAVLGLLLNLLFLTALLSILGATLTLPGIAGLVLTVGMAVDSNIIIFERIKEELALGVTTRAAVEAGFSKAHWTILDSNITTLISGMVLYVLGTGPIKGFAVTLCLGLLTTLFCALYVSRAGFGLFKLQKRDGTLSI